MVPDLSNTSDIDPEGWLTQLQESIPDWLDRFLAFPERVSEAHATEITGHAKALIKVMQDAMEPCQHEWVDARNSVIQSGEICLKCNALRAAPHHEEARRKAEKAEKSARETISEGQ